MNKNEWDALELELREMERTRAVEIALCALGEIYALQHSIYEQGGYVAPILAESRYIVKEEVPKSLQVSILKGRLTNIREFSLKLFDGGLFNRKDGWWNFFARKQILDARERSKNTGTE